MRGGNACSDGLCFCIFTATDGRKNGLTILTKHQINCYFFGFLFYIENTRPKTTMHSEMLMVN